MTRTLRRTAALAATATAAMLALSGCLSVTADISLDADAKASGTVAIGLQKQAASLLGLTDLDAFASGLSDQGQDAGISGSGLLELGECTASETDAEFVQTCTFSDETLADPEGWSATREGDTIVFTMVSAAEGGQDELLGDASLGELSVTVTFPGPITSISGAGATQTGDTQATITGSLSSPLDVRITSESSGGGGLLRTLLIVGGILLLIVVIAVVVFAVLRGRSGGQPEAATAGTAAVAAPPPVAETVVAETVAVEPIVEEIVVPEAVAEPIVEETVVQETVVQETVAEEVVAPEASGEPAPEEGQPPA